MAPKRLIFTTPKGVLRFPSLKTPNTKFSAEGTWEAPLILQENDPATVALLNRLQPLYDRAIEVAEEKFKELPVSTRKKNGAVTKNDLYTIVYDPDTEEPTGEIRFSFKMTASGVSKRTGKPWTRKPDIFDARRNRIVNIPEIWSGTTAKVSFEVATDMKTGEPGYFVPSTGAAGLSLRLAGVQIIDLVSGGSRDANSYGFEEEDGYEVSESAEEKDEEEAHNGGSNEEDDGDF